MNNYEQVNEDTFVSNPQANRKKITKLYAIISVDENAQDGMCAFGNSQDSARPLVFANKDGLNSFLNSAAFIAFKEFLPDGCELKVVEFSKKKVLQTIKR